MSCRQADPGRIDLERQLLPKRLRGAQLFKRSCGCWCASVWHRTTVGRQSYKLHLCIPSSFPYGQPNLYIESPRSLRTRDGRLVNSMGGVHEFHTCESANDWIELCYISGMSWHSGRTLYSVFHRGIVWVELFEIHKTTGRSLADLADELRWVHR
jgi:hypothetical protein